MTGGAVAAGDEVLVVGAVGRHQTAVGSVTAGTAIMHFRISSIGERRRIVVAAGAARRCNLDQEPVVRCIGRMDGFPSVDMTGGTVAAGNEVLTERQASEAAVHVVTAAAAVMGIGGCADQGIIMTACAARR